jgi:hypothetical protein
MRNRRSFFSFVSVGFVILLYFPSALAQDLPKEIRGYKVYKSKIAVKNAADKTPEKEPFEAEVKLQEPDLVDVSLTGITFDITAEIRAFEQSGKVDFLTFHNFQVNGLDVDVSEYRTAFAFKKGETVLLPKPARLFLGTGQVLKAAWKEMTESKKEWRITGRVFVFGKFKKMGFNFRRVVPVDIDLKIKNPVIDIKSRIID